MAAKQKTRAQLREKITELETVLAQNQRPPLTFTLAFDSQGRLLTASPSFNLDNELALTAMKTVLATVTRQVDELWRNAVRALPADSGS